MKSKLLMTIIGAAGLAGLATTSSGQGVIFFDNYDCTPYYPIMYGNVDNPALNGKGAGANVDAELGYALGANRTSGFTLLPSSITAVNPELVGIVNGVLQSGFFQGPDVTIPNYTSGPITFEILAWTTTGGTTFANAYYNNGWDPLIWTEPSIETAPYPAGYFTALPGPVVFVGPEPSTLALAGLGALISLVAFRRKQS